MLGIELRNTPVPVPGAPGLSVLNIDPDNAAESYRQRVLAQMGAGATAEELSTVREQLSGACTTEIASFDEFSSLLADGAQDWDHIVFDTAPTGHTLRLLSLPKAWTGFLDGNDRGASCLGPHSGLKMQEVRFKAALDALSDPAKTTVVLVTRPDRGAIAEAARTSVELRELGLNNQRLAVNGVFHASDRADAVACAIEDLGQQALDGMPASLRELPQDRVPLRPFDTVGLQALRALLVPGVAPVAHRHTAQDAGCQPAARPDGAGRRPGRGRPRPDHGDGQGRRRQDHHRRGARDRPRAARQDRAPEHHRSGGAPGRHARRRPAGPQSQPHRPEGRDTALHRQDHGCQVPQPRRAGAGAAAGGPAVPLHRGGGGLPCLLAHRQRGPQCLRGSGHRPHRALDAADGRDRCVPPADDARIRGPRRGARRDATHAAAGRRLTRRSSW